jgi:hypothetical protein
MNPILPGISIEELLDRYPGCVRFLIDKGLPCLVCGEPSWGTLEELARDKGWDDRDIDHLIEEMNRTFSGEIV